MVSTSPVLDPANGVRALPSASRIAPKMTTFTAPYLSAIAPKTGCAAPHISCPIASAKLIATMLNAGRLSDRHEEQAGGLAHTHRDQQDGARGEHQCVQLRGAKFVRLRRPFCSIGHGGMRTPRYRCAARRRYTASRHNEFGIW